MKLFFTKQNVTILIFLFIMISTKTYALDWFKIIHDSNPQHQLIFCGAAPAHPQDPAKGFLVAGFKCYDNFNHEDTYLVRIDCNGNILWEKNYPTLYAAKAAHYTDDFGFMVAGEFGLTKIDKDGNPAEGWIENGNPKKVSAKATKIVKRGIDQFMLLYGPKYPSLYYSYYRLCKENGEFLSEKIDLPGISPTGGKPLYLGILKTNDEGFMFVGGQQEDGLLLYKLSSTLQPDNSFGNNGLKNISTYMQGHTLDIGHDGGYIIAASGRNREIVLVKVDANGNEITENWNGRFDMYLDYFPKMLYSLGVKSLLSDDYMLAGIYGKDETDDADYFILRTDKNGNQKWIKKFTNSGTDGYF